MSVDLVRQLDQNPTDPGGHPQGAPAEAGPRAPVTTDRGHGIGASLSVAQVAAMIDEALWDPDLGTEDVLRGCQRAAGLGLAAVVCRPGDVALAARTVRGSPVKVATAVGLGVADGASSILQVLYEAAQVLDDGATEIALVCSAQRLNRRGELFMAEVAGAARLATEGGATVTVILETSRLTRQELISGCRAIVDAGAAMVQAGDSYSPDRATLTQVGLIRSAVGSDVLVKWNKPARTLDRMLIACAEGVDRFDADATTILAQARDRASLTPIRVPVPGRDY